MIDTRQMFYIKIPHMTKMCESLKGDIQIPNNASPGYFISIIFCCTLSNEIFSNYPENFNHCYRHLDSVLWILFQEKANVPFSCCQHFPTLSSIFIILPPHLDHFVFIMSPQYSAQCTLVHLIWKPVCWIWKGIKYAMLFVSPSAW